MPEYAGVSNNLNAYKILKCVHALKKETTHQLKKHAQFHFHLHILLHQYH